MIPPRFPQSALEVAEPAQDLELFDPSCLLAPRLSRETRNFLTALAQPTEAVDRFHSRRPEYADASGLEEIARRLTQIRTLALGAANTGRMPSAQTAADQFEADAAIDRIAHLTAGSAPESILRQLSPDHLGTIAEQDALYSLTDVLSGGAASLLLAPALALRVVRQAQEEITRQRRLLRNVHNALRNEELKNLQATLDHIVQTESYLRDRQMALECTNATCHQIEEHSLCGLMAQAMPEEVLALLCE